MIEKYNCKSHPQKLERFRALLSDDERRVLSSVCHAAGVQVPDLLVYTPDLSRYWFAEVKGPGDRLHGGQPASHSAIERELGVPVEIVRIVLDEGV